jgi:hypothetical protein
MTTITVQRPVASAAGAVGSRLRAAATRLMAFLVDWTEVVGRARAAEALRRLEATRVSEAAQLRRYARQWSRQDPRFMADLMAAADRHEREA